VAQGEPLLATSPNEKRHAFESGVVVVADVRISSGVPQMFGTGSDQRHQLVASHESNCPVGQRGDVCIVKVYCGRSPGWRGGKEPH